MPSRRSSRIDSRASRSEWPTCRRSRRSSSRAEPCDGIELAGDRLDLHAQRGQALEQRVVDLAAHARALGEDQRVALAQGAHAQPPRQRQQQRQPERDHDDEPARAVERRRHGEAPDAGLGPLPVVRGADPEAIAVGRQIRVGDLAALARVHPVVVVALELIAVAQLRRRATGSPRRTRCAAWRCAPAASDPRRAPARRPSTATVSTRGAAGRRLRGRCRGSMTARPGPGREPQPAVAARARRRRRSATSAAPAAGRRSRRRARTRCGRPGFDATRSSSRGWKRMTPTPVLTPTQM